MISFISFCCNGFSFYEELLQFLNHIGIFPQSLTKLACFVKQVGTEVMVHIQSHAEA